MFCVTERPLAVQERAILHVKIQRNLTANELMEALHGKNSDLLLQYFDVRVIPVHGVLCLNNIFMP
jgi:hypothetical protein